MLDSARRSPTRLTPPLKLIHVIADVPDRDPIEPALLQSEREAIRAAIPADDYALVQHGTLRALQQVSEHQRTHVTHFLGQGITPFAKFPTLVPSMAGTYLPLPI